MPPPKRKILDDKIAEMLDGVIEPARSPFAAPVVLVQKKCGELRFCVDFRGLNAITVRDAYPLPRIDDTLDSLRGNEFYSVLDLLSGFWQIPVRDSDKFKTAFVTPGGQYQFRVMPFGLTNAPATLQRLMDKVLAGLTWSQCVVYMDDIIVFGKTLDEHNANLDRVLTCIEQAKLKLKVSKCQFARREVIYLGHKVSSAGISTDPAKVEAICNAPVPDSKIKVRRFVAMANYYKRFVVKFNEIAAPLYKLTSKKVRFEWTAEAQAAFEQLKSALTTAPVLASPDFSQPFIIKCDASGESIGAVLMQNGHPIAYASKSLNKAQANYSATEREALAVVWTTRHFKHYVYGRKIIVHSDCKPLADTRSNKEPDGQLGRLMLKLQPLDIVIEYVRGQNNEVADCLSRLHSNAICVEPIDWREKQREDGELAQVIEAVEAGRRPAGTSFNRYQQQLRVVDGVLHHRGQVVLPVKMRVEFANDWHAQYGHESAFKMLKRFKSSYFWPHMSRDLRLLVRTCDTCQRVKYARPIVAPIGHIADLSVPELAKPFALVSYDFMGPFRTSTSGNRYVIVAVDYFTKWVEAAAVKDCSAVTTARFMLDNIIYRHGVPASVIADQAQNFESKIVAELCRLYKIRKLRSSPYHAEGNGAVERENRSIKELLRSYTLDSQADWDQRIPSIINARNTTRHESTGQTPFEMVYGRPFLATERRPVDFAELNSPSSSDFISSIKATRAMIEQAALKRLEKARRHQERQAKRRETGAREIAIGDSVLVSNEATHMGSTKKLEALYTGLYEVIGKRGPVDLVVAVKGKPKTIHRNRLKLYESSSSVRQPFVRLPSSAPRRLNSGKRVLEKQPPTRQGTPGFRLATDPAARVSRYGRPIRPPTRQL